MRVALIDPLGQWAGNHYYTDQLARGLTRAGADVTVYAHSGDVDHSPDRSYRYREPFNNIYGSRHIAWRGIQFLRCLAVTFAHIAHSRADIVHVQLWAHDFREVLQVALAKLLGKKVVLTAHEIHRPNYHRPSVVTTTTDVAATEIGRNFKWMMSRSAGIIVHNRYCLDQLTSSYLPKAPILVIPHVNQSGSLGELPDRSSARTRLNLPQDKMVFLFFGSCQPKKGLDVALRALAELKECKDQVLLVTAGKMKPHEEAGFRRLADELKLGDLVRIDVGLIPDDAALDYYRAADAVLLPYRQIYESGVAITASTCARAVVASDLPALLDVTENGRLGLHFRTGDPSGLARAMEDALCRQGELDSLGSLAREKVLTERDPVVIGAQTFALYEQVLATQLDKVTP